MLRQRTPILPLGDMCMRFDQVTNDKDRDDLEWISDKFDEIITAYQNKHILDKFLREDLLR